MLVPVRGGAPAAAADARVHGRLHDRRARRAAFTAAATLTRLAPQFATGMVARARPVSSLIVEAGIRGIAVPLTAACVGGLIGAALWFTRPPNKVHQHANFVRIALAGFAAAVLAVYAALGLVDVARIPQILQLAIHLRSPRSHFLLLRLGLHLALLHEAHDEIQSDEPVLCPHCNHVVPDMAFCPACGVATHASSRFSRKERRETRPTRGTAPTQPTIDDTLPGYSTTAGHLHRAAAAPRRRIVRLLRTWGVAIVVVAVAPRRAVGASSTSRRRATSARRTAGTPRPANLSRSTRASPPPTAPSRSPTPRRVRRTRSPRARHGIRADFLGGDGGTMQLLSRPANGRTPEQIANSLVNETFPDTKTAYEIPNAMVGYVARIRPGRRLLAAGRQQQLHADAGDGDGGGEERPRPHRRGRRPVPAVRPGLRAGQAVGREPATRPRHGQIRQQLQLAGRSRLADTLQMLTLTNVIICCCTSDRGGSHLPAAAR